MSIVLINNGDLCAIASDSRNIKDYVIDDDYQKLFAFSQKKLIVGAIGQSTFKVDGKDREIYDILPDTINKTKTDDLEKCLKGLLENKLHDSLQSFIQLIYAYIKDEKIYFNIMTLSKDSPKVQLADIKDTWGLAIGVNYVPLSDNIRHKALDCPAHFTETIIQTNIDCARKIYDNLGIIPKIGGDIQSYTLYKNGKLTD